MYIYIFVSFILHYITCIKINWVELLVLAARWLSESSYFRSNPFCLCRPWHVYSHLHLQVINEILRYWRHSTGHFPYLQDVFDIKPDSDVAHFRTSRLKADEFMRWKAFRIWTNFQKHAPLHAKCTKCFACNFPLIGKPCQHVEDWSCGWFYGWPNMFRLQWHQRPRVLTVPCRVWFSPFVCCFGEKPAWNQLHLKIYFVFPSSPNWHKSSKDHLQFIICTSSFFSIHHTLLIILYQSKYCYSHSILLVVFVGGLVCHSMSMSGCVWFAPNGRYFFCQPTSKQRLFKAQSHKM